MVGWIERFLRQPMTFRELSTFGTLLSEIPCKTVLGVFRHRSIRDEGYMEYGLSWSSMKEWELERAPPGKEWT